jgi:hypothetical protein
VGATAASILDANDADAAAGLHATAAASAVPYDDDAAAGFGPAATNEPLRPCPAAVRRSLRRAAASVSPRNFPAPLTPARHANSSAQVLAGDAHAGARHAARPRSVPRIPSLLPAPLHVLHALSLSFTAFDAVFMSPRGMSHAPTGVLPPQVLPSLFQHSSTFHSAQNLLCNSVLVPALQQNIASLTSYAAFQQKIHRRSGPHAAGSERMVCACTARVRPFISLRSVRVGCG